ncbi:MAG: phosphatidylserine decarboxylase [Epsilonproteobacteria bacterium]|nr:phosphatidylserine decarboxylase [Campylobacterota bacterium]NPA56231.1 phosphatidylserine decarboxylase [Campylobacterota bacterium]
MDKRVITAMVSRAFGRFASHPFPRPIQKFINRSYVGLLGLDMEEFEEPGSYRTLNALFTRALKEERPLQADSRYYIAPCDGLVTERGRVEGGKALQIKGMAYRVADLLTEIESTDLLKSYINFYLSPRDYHRYHMPYTLEIRRVIHVPGRLYPVNLYFLKRKVNLFVENERLILECRTEDGKIVIIVLIGALNVGEMTLVFEERIETNRDPKLRIFHYEGLWLKKGELLGYFKMGSTIVLFFEEEVQFLVESGERVRYTDHIARRESAEQ